MKEFKGVSFLVIVIAMVVVSMFVVTGLTLANTNFFMKQTEEKNANAKYTAETAINEIRVGLEEDISIIIQECYNAILSSSATIPAEQLDTEFKHLFISDLDLHFNGNIENDILKIENADKFKEWQNFDKEVDGKTKKDNKKIKSYIINKENVTITNFPEFEADYDNYKFTLKGISISYDDPKGLYSGHITTDIVIKAPEVFGSDSSNKKPESIYEEYSIIADTEISLGGTEGSGKVYAGQDGINIGSDTKEKVIMYGDVVTRGNILLNKAGTLSIEKLNEKDEINVYATNIETTYEGTLGLPSTNYKGISIDANISLNGDTILNVPYTNVEMKGNYYGYNNLYGSSGNGSSFAINGRNIDVDLSGIKTLYIGSTVSLDIPGDEVAANVIMGESLTGKFSQSMYLVPSCCITIRDKSGNWVRSSNPIKSEDLYTSKLEDCVQIALSENKARGGVKLEDYVNVADPYYYILTQDTASYIDKNRYYLYLKFDSPEKAAEYAYDYKITNSTYLDKRAKSFNFGNITIGENSTLSTAGNVLKYEDNEITLIMNNNIDKFKENSDNEMKTRLNKYKTLCSNLGTENVNELNDSLFKDLINEKEINEGEATSETIDGIECTNGKIVYYNDSITSKYTGNTYCAIVATGDITINEDFEGIIITTGKIDAMSRSLCGTFIAGGKITLRQVEYTNLTDKEESPLRYMLEYYENKNDIRKFFRKLKLYEDDKFDSSLIVKDIITFEKWNTR